MTEQKPISHGHSIRTAPDLVQMLQRLLPMIFIAQWSMFVCPSTGAAAAASEWEVVWQWHAPNHEVSDPSFSPQGDDIAFVRMLHWPDGHEAESVPEKTLDALHERAKTDERFADPEVVLLRIGGKDPKRVDWGWKPAFSPDGRLLSYAHQTKPSSGLRLMAGALRGNEIR